jgi:glycosyltransferase involved in cell wall biosynthesis
MTVQAATQVSKVSKAPNQALAPFVSVIVPAFNEERHVEQTLRGLLAQDYPQDRYEILVADGGSTDGTVRLVENLGKQHDRIRVVSNPARLSSGARNVGFRQGRGDFFIVVDAHCRVENEKLLAEMVETFERTGAFAMGRPQPLLTGGNGAVERAIVLARSSPLGHSVQSDIYSDRQKSGSIVSTGAMYRREVLDRVGEVDERFDACEDVEFNYRIERAGLKTHFAPELAVHYFGRGTLGGLFRQMVRYGRGRCRFLRKHPEAASIETFVPPAFVVALLSAPFALSMGPNWLAGAFGFLLAAYVAVVVASSISVGVRSKDWAAALRLPLVYPTIHVGLGLGFLRGVFERREQRGEGRK